MFLWLAPFAFMLLGGVIVLMARRQSGTESINELDATERAKIEKMLASRNGRNE